jgi:hypothetical protein
MTIFQRIPACDLSAGLNMVGGITRMQGVNFGNHRCHQEGSLVALFGGIDGELID